jgi:hypothetical protein
VADFRTDEGVSDFFLDGRIAFPKIDAVIINPAYDCGASDHAGVYLQCIHRAASVLRYRKPGIIVTFLNQTAADRVKNKYGCSDFLKSVVQQPHNVQGERDKAGRMVYELPGKGEVKIKLQKSL